MALASFVEAQRAAAMELQNSLNLERQRFKKRLDDLQQYQYGNRILNAKRMP